MTTKQQPSKPKPKPTVADAPIAVLTTTEPLPEPLPPERRRWTFTTVNRGLRQVIFPANHDKEGRCTKPPTEANFGGDTGTMGRWMTEKKEEAVGLREQMKKKTVADFNITETTVDPVKGDLVVEPTEEEEDAEPQSSAESRA